MMRLMTPPTRMKLQPVVLCGGAGTRLWPLSREQHPKQLLALTGTETLLQATVGRISDKLGFSGLKVHAPIVVANDECRFMTAEQLRQGGVPAAAILLEPAGRNTAPALALAALLAMDGGEDPALLVMPADHTIADVAAFRAAVVRGRRMPIKG